MLWVWDGIFSNPGSLFALVVINCVFHERPSARAWRCVWVCDMLDVSRMEIITPRDDERRIGYGVENSGELLVQGSPAKLEGVIAVGERQVGCGGC
jgi:hypothetical protein